MCIMRFISVSWLSWSCSSVMRNCLIGICVLRNWWLSVLRCCIGLIRCWF